MLLLLILTGNTKRIILDKSISALVKGSLRWISGSHPGARPLRRHPCLCSFRELLSGRLGGQERLGDHPAATSLPQLHPDGLSGLQAAQQHAEKVADQPRSAPQSRQGRQRRQEDARQAQEAGRSQEHRPRAQVRAG